MSKTMQQIRDELIAECEAAKGEMDRLRKQEARLIEALIDECDCGTQERYDCLIIELAAVQAAMLNLPAKLQ